MTNYYVSIDIRYLNISLMISESGTLVPVPTAANLANPAAGRSPSAATSHTRASQPGGSVTVSQESAEKQKL